ncbi:unnamed protein product [Bursaphelenchus xylophilus]|uniref:(pine wood nematode) hypothetical protein n=1 Tax=Bursaphelenchus xylophilus TaxID=6326 RepID=A0A1I7S5P6_BURXY|nr:unnamed protein product [Bursaphelenchus xylophilus]CAG9124937.1 unnamed protein product [Bursaphelenchus xylophilus]
MERLPFSELLKTIIGLFFVFVGSTVVAIQCQNKKKERKLNFVQVSSNRSLDYKKNGEMVVRVEHSQRISVHGSDADEEFRLPATNRLERSQVNTLQRTEITQLTDSMNIKKTQESQLSSDGTQKQSEANSGRNKKGIKRMSAILKGEKESSRLGKKKPIFIPNKDRPKENPEHDHREKTALIKSATKDENPADIIECSTQVM